MFSIRVMSGPVVDALNNFSRRLDGEMYRANDQLGAKIAKSARDIAPFRTGQYRAGIDYQVKGGVIGGVTVEALAPYSMYLEMGTRAHGPVRAKFLVFEIGGKKIFTKHVRGIKAQHILQRAIDAHRAEISEIMLAAVKKAYGNG